MNKSNITMEELISKELISKELLSEVLGAECTECYFEDTYNIINYKFEYDVTWSDDIQYDTSNINIYELAHKSKEWALTKGYCILSALAKNGTIMFDKRERSINNYRLFKKGKTEQEAIFKACQWILDNTN